MLETIDLTNCTAGELSPRLKGRTDLAKYFNGLDTMLNMVTMPQGGATKRPGTLFATLVKNQSLRARLKGFIFSTVQAYMLEFGQGYVRVMKNDAPVVNIEAVTGAANNGSNLIRLALTATAGLFTGNTMTVAGVVGTAEANGTWLITVIDTTHVDLQGSGFVNVYVSGGTTTTPVEIPVPYQAADLPALGFTQSADTLYICHPNYPTATLTRSAHTNWAYGAIVFLDGPYLPVNTTSTTLTLGATSGVTTLTASAALGINNGQGFLATDVGRAVRYDSTKWAWGTITSFTDNLHVGFTFGAAVTGGADSSVVSANATQVWQLGKWSGTTGYPYLPTFWQQRLMMFGTNNQPNAIEGSMTANFTTFSPTADDGTVTASNALSWVISDDQVNAARWISTAGSAQAAQLGIGTSGAEDIMQPASTSQALSSTNVQVYRESAYGSAPNVVPLRIGKSVLFADRTARKLREWTFYWQVNGYLGPDLTQNSEHITRGPAGSAPATWGIAQMCYQQSPYQIVWAVLNTGGLVAFTYDRDQQVFAPSRHQLGGQYYGGPPIVESLDVIPSPDGTYDELWLSVLRTINGVPTRMIEVMTRYFDALPQDQAFFVDAGLSSTLTFPSANLTPPALANANAANLAMAPSFTGTGNFTADAAVFAGTSADVGRLLRVNGGSAVVTAAVSTTVVTAQVLMPLQGLAPAASAAWSFTAPITTVTGLGYLNGETAAVLGDAAVLGTQVVKNGAVTLVTPGASLITAGLPYTPVLVGMPFEPQRAAQALSQGKAKRIDHIYIRFHESLGCDYGRRVTDSMTGAQSDSTDPLESRNAANPMGQPPPLYSGIKKLPMRGGFDQEGQFLVLQEEPLPLTVLSISARAEIGEQS